MKKIIGLFISILIISSFSFARGRTDNEIPQNEVDFEVSEDEKTEPEEKKPLYILKKPEGETVKVKESWGYVSMTRKEEFNADMPLTDVCFFSAEVNCYGELTSIPKRSALNVGKARSHLVITCESKSLTHMILDPTFGIRKQLIREIVKAGTGFDGVQIDFELIPLRDRKHFLTFLSDLRTALGKAKWFSVCVPARTRLLSDDIYPYAEIAKLVDRVFIMAYDESWSGSKPGPIASVNWCKKVMDYAQKTIPERKLIMGIPFYGRTWANEATEKAWYFSGIERIMTENQVPGVVYENDIPTFRYVVPIEVTGYFNDAWSVINLCRTYEEANIKKIGFWRIGMEDPDIWKWIEISK